MRGSQPACARRRSSWWTKYSSVLASRSTPGSRYGVSPGSWSARTISSYGARAALRHGPLGEAGQERDRDPGGAGPGRLADQQVRDEVAGGPVAAEGRGVRSEGERGVAQRVPLAAVEGEGHAPNVTGSPTVGARE